MVEKLFRNMSAEGKVRRELRRLQARDAAKVEELLVAAGKITAQEKARRDQLRDGIRSAAGT